MSPEKRLRQENRTARNVLLSAVFCAFAAAALWLAFLYLLSVVINRVFLAHQALDQVAPLLGLMFALLLARAGLLWASDVFGQQSANRVKQTLRERLNAKFFALGPLYTRGERAGELVHTATAGIETLDEYVSQFQPARLLAGLVPAMVFLVILFLDVWTLPILLFTGPILVLLLALIGGRARELTARRFAEMSWMSAHFLDVLQGLPTLKLFGRSKEQAQTIETISQQYGNSTMQVLRTAFQTSLVLEWGATAATALVAIQVSVRLMSGLLPFEIALAVLLLTPEFFQPLRNLAIKYHAGTTGKAALERVYAILDASSAQVIVNSDAPLTRAKEIPATINLFFENVSVWYDNERRALDGFTLNLAHGQTLALVGETGAGKTTVANLLLRFVEPTQGKILCDGVPLRELDADAWRAHIAYVSQHPHLFHGTAAENLQIAKPGATRAEMMAAARAAHIHDFIETLPRGYDTLLGERGARLSGGQRQRLALARAFLKNAPLLILDEATSHLDAETEEQIRASLASFMRTRTTIIIAHRLTLAQDADLIAVMEQGRIVEQGTPRALLTQNGKYENLRLAYEGAA